MDVPVRDFVANKDRLLEQAELRLAGQERDPAPAPEPADTTPVVEAPAPEPADN